MGRSRGSTRCRCSFFSSVSVGFWLPLFFLAVTSANAQQAISPQTSNANNQVPEVRTTPSVGIAAMTTMLSRGGQIHQAAMVHNINPYDPEVQQRVQEIAHALPEVQAEASDKRMASSTAWSRGRRWSCPTSTTSACWRFSVCSAFPQSFSSSAYAQNRAPSRCIDRFRVDSSCLPSYSGSSQTGQRG
jgi:hypothetical protein